MRIVTAEEVHEICGWERLVDALAAAHRGPKPEVGRLSLECGDGPSRQTYINMPAWLPGVAMGSKLVTVMPDNPDRFPYAPAVQAVYALFDGRDGAPLAVIDGTAMTYRKTAADSALGSRLLSRADARVLAMVGAGGLAPYLIEAHLAVRPSIERILVWNRRMEKAEAVARQLAGRGISASPSALEPAVRAADVISCATASTSPLVRGDWLKPGAHLDLVGSFTPEMRECDDECVRRARLFVNSRWFAIDGPGDLGDPIGRGIIGRDKVEADLFELCGGGYGVDRRAEEVTLYKNAGGPHLDLFTALFIWSHVDKSLRESSDS